MKKTNIFAAVASLALLAGMFTGCVTDNPDLDPIVDLSKFYLRGNMNNWGNGGGSSTDKDALAKDCALTENADGSFSITYTAKSASDEFAIANEGWTEKYCNGTEIAVGTADSIDVAFNGGNAKITGQVPGNNYKMTITPLSSSVKIKVELAGANVPDFYILDTTTGLTKMEYDGKSYIYAFEASDVSETLTVWSKDKYYRGKISYNADNPTSETLTSEKDPKSISVSGLTKGDSLKLVLNVSDETVSAKVILAIPEHFKVIMTFVDNETGTVKIKSNISWSGVKSGSWSVDGKKFDNTGKEANITDHKLIFYISKDYDIAGTWVAGQAPKGANFKFEATIGNGKPDGGLWYKLPLDKDTVEITYSKDRIE